MANYFTQLLHDSQSLYTPLTTSFNTATPAATRMNIETVVLRNGNQLEDANISINGVHKTKTDANGFFFLSNILSTDIIKVTHIGYKSFEAEASKFPTAVDMMTEAEVLKEVTITGKSKPKNKTNWLLWLGIGTGLGLIAYKMHSAKATVKAKI